MRSMILLRSLLWNLRLVALGVAIGLLARYLLGTPEAPGSLDRRFTDPLPVQENGDEVEMPDFPILK